MTIKLVEHFTLTGKSTLIVRDGIPLVHFKTKRDDKANEVELYDATYSYHGATEKDMGDALKQIINLHVGVNIVFDKSMKLFLENSIGDTTPGAAIRELTQTAYDNFIALNERVHAGFFIGTRDGYKADADGRDKVAQMLAMDKELKDYPIFLRRVMANTEQANNPEAMEAMISDLPEEAVLAIMEFGEKKPVAPVVKDKFEPVFTPVVENKEKIQEA